MSYWCRCSYWLMGNSYIYGGFNLATTQLWLLLGQRTLRGEATIWGCLTAFVHCFTPTGFLHSLFFPKHWRHPTLTTHWQPSYRRIILIQPLDILNITSEICYFFHQTQIYQQRKSPISPSWLWDAGWRRDLVYLWILSVGDYMLLDYCIFKWFKT